MVAITIGDKPSEPVDIRQSSVEKSFNAKKRYLIFILGVIIISNLPYYRQRFCF
jgi:hypothetical protein